MSEIDNKEMARLLRGAEEEIRLLRRVNEVLEAKVQTMELFATVLHTRPAERGGGMAEDIAWKLGRAAEALEAAA